MKKDDPFATLGIQWGATTTEIKDAFKNKARELHPDVNKTDSPEQALKKFQSVQQAYTKLMDVKGAPHRDDLLDVSIHFKPFSALIKLLGSVCELTVPLSSLGMVFCSVAKF
jgi:hypothetical protein